MVERHKETLAERLDPERHPFLTVTELVDLLHMDRVTVLDGIKRDPPDIPAVRVGRAWRVPTIWARSQVFPAETSAVS
jgi:hypothetical protein